MSVSVTLPNETVMHRLFARWTRHVQRRAITVLVLISAVTAVAFWYTANHLAIKTSTTDMIASETPFRRNAIAFDAAFPQLDNLIVAVIDAPTADDARAAADVLTSGLQKRTDLFNRVEAPQADEYFLRNGLLFYEIEALEALADQLARGEPLLAALAQQPNLTGLFDVLGLMLSEGGEAMDTGEAARLLNQISKIAEAEASRQPGTFSWRALFDSDTSRGRRQLVIAQPNFDASAFAPAAKALGEIRRLADNIENDGITDITIRLTGSPAINHEELQSVELGGKTAGWLSLTLVVALLIAGLRSLRLIVPTLVTLVVGLVWTAAFAALAIGHLNLISVAFAVLFIGLGVDFSIHYCLRFRECAGAGDALPRTAATVGGSLAIGAACAAIGFLSFVPTDYKGLGELGLISGGGMVIAFFVNMTLLPAMLALFKGAFPSTPPPAHARDPISRRFHRQILVGAALCAALAATAVPFARFDFNPMNLKDPANESVAAFHDLARDGASGVYAIDVLAADRDNALRTVKRLRELPEVGRILTLENFVPTNQEEKLALIEDMAFFLLPALTAPPASDAPDPLAALKSFQETLRSNRAGVLQAPVERLARALDTLSHSSAAEGLERRLTAHLPALLSDLRTLLTAEPVTIDDIPARIRQSWITPDGRVRVQAWPDGPIADNDDLRRFAAAVLAVAPNAVGTPVTITEAGTAVVTAFRQATLTAFILVIIVLLAVLRRASETALVLAPLVLAALLTGATSVILDLPFNFANVIVLPLLFGLGVASGVHLVVRRRRTVDAAELLRTSTPRAVLYSALTTIASFGSLALSGHRGMTSMGQLLTVAIAYTLICTLVVLPALMAWLDQRDLDARKIHP